MIDASQNNQVVIQRHDSIHLENIGFQRTFNLYNCITRYLSSGCCEPFSYIDQVGEISPERNCNYRKYTAGLGCLLGFVGLSLSSALYHTYPAHKNEFSTLIYGSYCIIGTSFFMYIKSCCDNTGSQRLLYERHFNMRTITDV